MLPNSNQLVADATPGSTNEHKLPCGGTILVDNRILIVEDQERLRRTLSQVLVKEGFDLTFATNGPDARAIYEVSPFPVVITDIDIPEVAGIDLLKTVKTIDADAQIIVMTGHAALESALAAIRAGAYDCVIKPFEDRDLITSVVRRAMSRFHLKRENRNLIDKLKQKTKALEEANALLNELATRDGLTGLYNHRHFQEKLGEEINRAQRYEKEFSLLFIDLDHFKTFNDTNGHIEGDHLLRSMSELFSESFRKTDLVARYGGDEFVVILPETSKDTARMLADKLCSRIACYPFAGRASMPDKCITISIGCASYPVDGSSTDTLLRHADQALYTAKAEGRGVVR